MTLDTDIAIPGALAAGEQDLRERLLAKGFKEEFQGDDRPPATHYRLGDDATGFYAEFLTPLVGGEYGRNDTRKATTRIGGVASQRLRHLDLLLHDPWPLDFDLNGLADQNWTRVRIANPASFLAQKVLIHPRRTRAERAKDILYMHDTLQIFGGHLSQLRDEWANRITHRLHLKNGAKVRTASEALFGETSDAIRDAEVLVRAVGRTVSAEAIRESCHLGFQQVFG